MSKSGKVKRPHWREIVEVSMVGPSYALRIPLVTAEQYAEARKLGRHAIKFQLNDGSSQYILLPEPESAPE